MLELERYETLMNQARRWFLPSDVLWFLGCIKECGRIRARVFSVLGSPSVMRRILLLIDYIWAHVCNDGTNVQDFIPSFQAQNHSAGL